MDTVCDSINMVTPQRRRTARHPTQEGRRTLILDTTPLLPIWAEGAVAKTAPQGRVFRP